MKGLKTLLLAAMLSLAGTAFAGFGMEMNDTLDAEEVDPYINRDELVQQEAQDRQQQEKDRMQQSHDRQIQVDSDNSNSNGC
jgi:hypothetical protein